MVSTLKLLVFVLRPLKRDATEPTVEQMEDARAGLVSGTLCGGEVQGHFAQKLASCEDCDFYKQVHEEEGPACQQESEVLLCLSDPGQIVHAYEELRHMHAKLKETQAELLQARKLEAIGQLAAGIAHEINTPTQFYR